MSNENKFSEDLIEQIAGFFADKIGNPQLAYEIVGCSGGSTCSDSSSCCCSCASPSDQSDCGCGF